ncbi:hypothetical protein [Tabrizicola sp.]|jgi:hypothetical protein|uniref:hypothetical protein n=1 Tax=Tabrizicola sp. TaxID=2005166 RepID=UPI001A49F5DA|nr:hypothetical protein [Tabrizicola sp.]MBL9064320.1 hypothetical protein [Tabrizicola sp.]
MPVSRRHVVLGLAVALAGCGKLRQSKLNPFNWFKKSEPRETIVLPGKEEDPRPLVDTVLTMAVEPIPGGAVVRARGVTPTQGWWDAELVARDVDEKGVLVYDFRLVPPTGQTDVSTQQSREIDVAIYISDVKLEAVREIVVQGAKNARVSRR